MSDPTRERPARPGETCTCGRQAVIVYMTADHGDVGYCGIPHPAQSVTPQQRAHALLGQLLEREGLPVIEWGIATHGMLTGRCVNPDHAKRPAELRAWAEALGLHDWPEQTGRRWRRLQVVRENVAPGVDVEVLADISTDGRS